MAPMEAAKGRWRGRPKRRAKREKRKEKRREEEAKDMRRRLLGLARRLGEEPLLCLSVAKREVVGNVGACDKLVMKAAVATGEPGRRQKHKEGAAAMETERALRVLWSKWSDSFFFFWQCTCCCRPLFLFSFLFGIYVKKKKYLTEASTPTLAFR